jgi:hypothetical protein
MVQLVDKDFINGCNVGRFHEIAVEIIEKTGRLWETSSNKRQNLQAIYIYRIRYYFLHIFDIEFMSLCYLGRDDLMKSIRTSGKQSILMHPIVVAITRYSVVGVDDVSNCRIDNLQPMFLRDKSKPIMLSSSAIFHVKGWLRVSSDWVSSELLIANVSISSYKGYIHVK